MTTPVTAPVLAQVLAPCRGHALDIRCASFGLSLRFRCAYFGLVRGGLMPKRQAGIFGPEIYSPSGRCAKGCCDRLNQDCANLAERHATRAVENDVTRYTVDVHNLLLGLAWFGSASTGHVGRLWLPGRSVIAVRSLLTELRAEGYVERRLWADWVDRRSRPVRRDALWSLTRKGVLLVRDADQFPPEYKGARPRRMFPHDSQTSEAVVRLIELMRDAQRAGQTSLSGVYLEREIRLDPARRRPVMDALVILTYGGERTPDHLVPWSRDPTLAGERRVRYALENDRASEPLSVIAGKAHAYQQAGTAQWVRRYGPFPLPLWLVPDERRLNAILETWRREWPVGKWLLTTDAWLQHDRWIEYNGGTTRERGLLTTRLESSHNKEERT